MRTIDKSTWTQLDLFKDALSARIRMSQGNKSAHHHLLREIQSFPEQERAELFMLAAQIVQRLNRERIKRKA